MRGIAMTLDFSTVPTRDLAVVERQLSKDSTVTKAELRSWGLDEHADRLFEVLSHLPADARLACVRVALAERQRPQPEIEVTWTGFNESRKNRETRIILKQLIRQAKEHLVVTLYRYDDLELMGELKAAAGRGVKIDLFLDVEQRERTRVEFAEVRAQVEQLRAFWKKSVGPETPFVCRVFYDARVLAGGVYLSMHAKCLVVDQHKTYIGSANFTDRGTTRNVEIGMVVTDEATARQVLEVLRGGAFVEFVEE